MAADYRAEVTNRAAFDTAMAEAAKAATDVGADLAEAGRATVRASDPPRRTGRLAAAARVTTAGANRARITVDTPYAAVIHWGWPAHNIRRQPWLVAQWLRDPAPLAGVSRAIQAGLDRAAART